MLLPFQLMLNHLEAAIIHEYEVAYSISLESAKKLDVAFMTHVDKFEVTVRAKLEEICNTWQK